MINLNKSVNELMLSVRAENGLRNANIQTVAELIEFMETDGFICWPNIGKVTRKEIADEVERWKAEQDPNWEPGPPPVPLYLACGQPPVVPPPPQFILRDVAPLLEEANQYLRMMATDATTRQLMEINESLKLMVAALKRNGYLP